MESNRWPLGPWVVNMHAFIRPVLACLCGLWAVSVGAQTHPIFVLNSLSASVSVIDPKTWQVTRQIPTGKQPHHLYLTPDEKSIIVANAGGDSLSFIDPKTAQVQRVVRGTVDPYHLRFSPDMKWFITVANRLDHIDIYRWDGQTRNWLSAYLRAKPPAICGSTPKAPPLTPACKTAMSWWRWTWPRKA